MGLPVSSPTVVPTLSFHFADDKDNPDYGLKICQWIDDFVKDGFNGYYTSRNERFLSNRLWSEGKQDMNAFRDLMSIKGRKAFIHIDFSPPAIMPKYIQQIMDTFMSIDEDVQAEAVDTRSRKRRERDKKEAMFRMMHAQEIARYQQQSGAQLENPNEFTPDNKEELDIFFNLEYKLPEEAITEEATKKIFDENGFDTIKRVVIRDMVTTGLGVARVYTDVNGAIKIRRVKPENFFYSYTEYPDFRDCSFMGEKINMKITEFRKRFSKSFSEKEIWRMAMDYGEGQNKDRCSWDTIYEVSQYRPYDEWTMPVIYVEVKTDNSLFVKEKVSKKNIPIIDISTKKPEKVGENTTVSEKNLDKLYEGWYLSGAGTMLEWGKSKYDIRPQNNLSEQFFTYCPYMYDAFEMTNTAIPEKIKSSVTQMILAHLKIQQLVAKMKPAGTIYDISGLNNINLGDGQVLTPLKMQRYYQQTGDWYWNSEDEEGNRKTVPPILPAPNVEGVAQIQELIGIYNFYLERLQDDLGTNPAAAGQPINPRMGLGVMRQQIRAANSSISNIYEGWLNIGDQISNKVAILLWDDILYQTGVYKQYFEGKEYDKDSYFKMKMSLAPSAADKEYIENLTQTAVSAGILDFSQAFKVRNIKNPKIAELYLAKMQQQKMDQEMKMAQMRIRENQAVQNQSVQMNTRSKAMLDQLKAKGDLIKSDMEAENKQELELQKFVQQALLESMKTGKPLTPHVQEIVETYLSGNYNPQNNTQNRNGESLYSPGEGTQENGNKEPHSGEKPQQNTQEAPTQITKEK